MIIDFEKPYNRLEYLYFLQNHLLPDDFESIFEKIDILQSTKYIQEINLLGVCNSLGLKIYEIEHRSENDPRVSLSKETFRIMANYSSHRALVLFISSSSLNYRFSLVTLNLELEGKRVLKKYSNPRRYSFFLGPDCRKHTPQEYLIQKGRISNLDDLKNRFSIEVVNKEFYEKIALAFTKLVGGKRKVGSRIKEFEPRLTLPGIPPTHHQKYQEFAVRLIGRLVFVWFLKKKRSKDNISLVPDRLVAKDAVSKNYYHDVLEKLFFQVLNTPISDRLEEYNTELWANIPFLNGGLFEPNREDYYDIDPLLNTSKNVDELIIPDDWFEKLFDIFETYNFTIDENTSIDIELSIEPEMLGRIFENLLAEINPETGETARKNTGSYYTPRSIVEYMVDESLKQYLLTNTEITEEKIISLLDYSDETDTLTDSEKLIVINVLDDIKVIDPACGSGAFPMGLLQKMLLILQKVDPESIVWLIKHLDRIPDVTLRREVEDKLVNENWNYIHKLGIIQNSIYGIDIQPIAVEISKLRFFLSLVVDGKIDDNKENRGLRPLPNLEFKFVCANSLIGLPETENTESQEALFKDTFFDDFNREVQNYFNASKPKEKHNVRGKIEALIDKKTQEKFENIQASNKYVTGEAGRERNREENQKKQIEIMELWNSYKNLFKNEPVSFFDIQYFFPKCNDGFDIVIANPPYIQLQKDIGDGNNTKYADLYKGCEYETFKRTGDIYALFYELGINVLKEGGHLTYITSNKWMRAGYGDVLRGFFAKHNPKLLLDFGGFKVFESATVDVNIIIVCKDKRPFVSMNATHFKNDYQKGDSVADYFENNKVVLTHLTSDTWFIGSKAEIALKQKIEDIGTPLKDWDVNIYRGVLTGYNTAFIIDEAKRAELIAQDPKSADIIKPILRGRDIKRYGYEFAGLYLIDSHNGYTDENGNRIAQVDIDDYPAVKTHLDQHWGRISVRQDKGVTPYNLRNCAYYPEFAKEKVVFKAVGRNLTFSLLEPNSFITAPASFMTSKYNRYILGNLLSVFVKYFIYKNADRTGAGDIMLNVQSFEQIPIPLITASNRHLAEQIEKLVELRLAETNGTVATNDTVETHGRVSLQTKIETEIDQLVCALYGLTEEEIAIVENSVEY